MRTTLTIDDDVMAELREQAHRRGVSLSKLVNRVLRQGLETATAPAAQSRRFRQRTHAMGAPRADLTKALALADQLDEEAVARELAQRK